jgi:hypothetical protein
LAEALGPNRWDEPVQRAPSGPTRGATGSEQGHRWARVGAPPGPSRGTAGPESLDLGCGRKRVWKGIAADEGAAKRGSNLAKPSPGEVQENGIRYTVPVWCTHITLVVNYSKKL